MPSQQLNNWVNHLTQQAYDAHRSDLVQDINYLLALHGLSGAYRHLLAIADELLASA